MDISKWLKDGFVDIVSNIVKDKLSENEDIEDVIEDKDIIEKRNRSDSVDSGFAEDDDDIVDEDCEDTVISLDEVLDHDTRDDAWIVIYDKVYDITNYFDKIHPGGEDVIVEYLGYDATLAFRSVGHSRGALRLLEKYCIGVLPYDERMHFITE